MSANPTLISNVRDFAVKIVNGDGTGKKSLGVAPPAAGTRVKTMIITSDDTVLRTLQIVKTVGGAGFRWASAVAVCQSFRWTTAG